MPPRELNCWLALNRIPDIGAQRLIALLERFGDAERVYAAPRSELEEVFGAHQPAVAAILKGLDERALETDLAWLDADGNQLVTIRDSTYPRLLRELPDPPALLFVCGDLQVLASPQIAIVGSRNPTPAGRENAQAFAEWMAQNGVTVTSGLALGIDGVAHRGALAARGRTIAVAGTGLDRVYPARHHELAHQIAAQGALVSEFPLGSGPLREHFPRRNRLISGLSLGTLVVEAALQSGSLITARLAAEQGREVFAIPGSIHSPLSRGCHALIREGAKLVETAQDILEELGPLAGLTQPGAAPAEGRDAPPDPTIATLLNQLGHEPVTLEILVRRTGLTAGAVSSMLLQMELRNLVAVCPGGAYVRIS